MRRKGSHQFQPDLVAPRDAAQGQAFTGMAVLQDDIWTTVLSQRVLRLVKMPNEFGMAAALFGGRVEARRRLSIT